MIDGTVDAPDVPRVTVPITPSVPAMLVFPVAAVTLKALVPIVTLPLDVRFPLESTANAVPAADIAPPELTAKLPFVALIVPPEPTLNAPPSADKAVLVVRSPVKLPVVPEMAPAASVPV